MVERCSKINRIIINRIISCKYDPTNPLMTFQRHKHTHTCYKGNRQVCRFRFPKYVMDKTEILESLPKNLTKPAKKQNKDNLKKIDGKMNQYFKTNTNVSFEDMLKELWLTRDQYIDAIRSTIKEPTVFLKRSSL